MKIAFIGQEKEKAGKGEYSFELARRLAKKGQQVFFYEATDGKTSAVFAKNRQIKTINISSPKVGRKLGERIYLWLSIGHALLERYDVIHIYADYLPTVATLFALFSRKTVLVFTFRFQKGRRKKKRSSWGEFLALTLADQAITVEKTFAKFVLEKYGRKIHLMPWGISDAKILCDDPKYLKKWNLQKNNYILCVADLEASQKIHLAIFAFKSLEDSHLSREKKLVIVGEDPKGEYSKEIKDTTRGRENIIFISRQSEDVLEQLIEGCYLYLQSAENKKFFPVFLKAARRGKTVLSADFSANRDFLDNDMAVFFSSKDECDLEEKMVSMINNPEVIRKMGEVALSKIRAKHGWESIANRFENICKDILSRKQKKGFLKFVNINKTHERNI